MSEQGEFIVHGQYIKDLSFENPNAPESLMSESKPEINISFDIKVDQVNEEAFEVTILTNIKAVEEEKSIFIIELAYAGIFSITEEDEEELEKRLLVQCPTYLFPYIRRVISDLTRDGGFIPLMLQPIDFLGLYTQKRGTVNDNTGNA